MIKNISGKVEKMKINLTKKQLVVPLPSIEKQEKIVAGVKTIYEKTKRPRQEAEGIVAGVQKEVEQMILA